MLTKTREECVQLISPDGELQEEARAIWEKKTPEEKVDLYQWMTLIRQFDRKCVMLQRQGRIGTYAPLEGQEAAQVGSALALSREDWIFPSYREHGVAMIAGMPMSQILLYWMGRVEGCKAPEGVRLMPPTVPIATQIPQAVGAAWAAKLKKESFVAIAYFGDGATSEGDFHEACNFAGVFQVPAILFCQNNGYAISVPFSRQSASKTVAERAQAYSFEGIRVDGNDVLAVFEVTKQAVMKAKNGGGPTLIEAVTYRKGAHTTADDASKYRDVEEVEEWVRYKDPLTRYERCLRHDGLWDDAKATKWLEECKERIDQAVQIAESTEPANPTHLFAHVFDTLPSKLQRQQAELTCGVQ